MSRNTANIIIKLVAMFILLMYLTSKTENYTIFYYLIGIPVYIALEWLLTRNDSEELS